MPICDLTLALIFIGFLVAVCLNGHALIRSIESHPPRCKMPWAKHSFGETRFCLSLWPLNFTVSDMIAWFLD